MNKTILITNAALIYVATCGMASAATITATQTITNNRAGSADYGQGFALDSTVFTGASYTLDEMVFYWAELGTNGGTAAQTAYLDIFGIGTANLGTLDFSNGAEVSNLSYLGSSDNSINLTTGLSTGDELQWTFSGVALTPSAVSAGIQYIAVLSGNSSEGNFFGQSLQITNTSGGKDYSNLSAGNSDPFFGGTRNTDAQDHKYSFAVTVVPEPGSLALLVTTGLLIALRRRRH